MDNSNNQPNVTNNTDSLNSDNTTNAPTTPVTASPTLNASETPKSAELPTSIIACLIAGAANALATLLLVIYAFTTSSSSASVAALWTLAITSIIFFIPLSIILTAVCAAKASSFHQQNFPSASKFSKIAAAVSALPMIIIGGLLIFIAGFAIIHDTIGVSLSEQDPYTATGQISSTATCEGIHPSTLKPTDGMSYGTYAREIACAYAMHLHETGSTPHTESELLHYLPSGYLDLSSGTAQITFDTDQPTKTNIFNVVQNHSCKSEGITANDPNISVWYREPESSRRACAELVFWNSTANPFADPAGSWYYTVFRDYPNPGRLEYSNEN